MSSGCGGGVVAHLVEHGEHLPSDVALQTADDLLFGLALLEAPRHVVLGRRVVAQPHHHDPVQRSVGLAVTAAVEAVAGGLAGGRLDRGDTAPTGLREQLRGLSASRLVRAAAELEPGKITSPLAAAMLALRTLAHRHQALSAEISSLTTELDRLTAKAAPKLVALFGVGQDSAGALLVAAGDNPDRLRSDACFSMLCGVSPIEASSGKTTRHRLNRGGDRQANAALYRIVMVRLCYDPATKDYMARRLKEGKSKKEVIRCLKRYVAREVFAVLHQMGHDTPTAAA